MSQLPQLLLVLLGTFALFSLLPKTPFPQIAAYLNLLFFFRSLLKCHGMQLYSNSSMDNKYRMFDISKKQLQLDLAIDWI